MFTHMCTYHTCPGKYIKKLSPSQFSNISFSIQSSSLYLLPVYLLLLMLYMLTSSFLTFFFYLQASLLLPVSTMFYPSLRLLISFLVHIIMLFFLLICPIFPTFLMLLNIPYRASLILFTIIFIYLNNCKCFLQTYVLFIK